MSNTDFFQERAASFEQARRRLESPGERSRATGSIPRADTGSQPLTRAKPQVLAPRTITWGTTFKISVAVYFAVMGVLVTVALLVLLGLRLVGDLTTFDGINVQWRSLPAAAGADKT
ncbi:hypothetical protein [Kineosporia babensis]|uniref:Uncharacterized protein n=1 Tax=Kineosporia babensis TaxID=499548 RepID=A0A9X1NDD3_9ACTN|nr:hypothetical protein [Kineosporia babensis]MCD5311704.1 hypothetical protein [Kineosporia babensis]